MIPLYTEHMAGNEILKTAADLIFEEFPDLQGLYLYGSFFRGDFGPESDLDLGLLLPPRHQIEPLRKLKLLERLVAAVGRSVDLVELRETNTVLQFEIICNSRVLIAGNQSAISEFEMYVLSFYQKLNEERAEILEAFEKKWGAENAG